MSGCVSVGAGVRCVHGVRVGLRECEWLCECVCVACVCVRVGQLFQRSAWPPQLVPQVASITKVMTFLVAHDGITEGRVSLQDPVLVAATVGGTTAELQVLRHT